MLLRGDETAGSGLLRREDGAGRGRPRRARGARGALGTIAGKVIPGAGRLPRLTDSAGRATSAR